MSDTPILDALIADVPDVCGSIGPRIGEDGSPRCAEPLNHGDLHRGFEGSGFEHEHWGYPVHRDREFAADWKAWVVQQRRDMLDFL